jgi:hypothetical protein
MSAAQLWSLTQGWHGAVLAFASVQAPMLAALAQARAGWRHWLLAPFVSVPATLAASLGSSLLCPALGHFGLAASGLAQLTIGLGVCLGTGYAAGRLLGRSGASMRVSGLATHAQQGAQWVEGRQRMHGEELSLAGIRVPVTDEAKHFKFVGTTGTGKSTAIAQLLAGALARGDRAVIADPDGGYLRRFYDPDRGDVILNPFDQRSLRWDLFAEIRREYDFDELARSLIPDHEGADRSWRGYGRTFFTAVARQAHASGVRDTRELYRLLTVAETPELAALTRGTPAQPFLEDSNARMFHSLRSVTSSAVASLEYVAQQSSQPFSIREWIERDRQKQPGVLFIPYRAGQIAALRSTISAWMRLAIFSAMEKPEADQRLWFVVDELDALGPIDGLKDALARVRKFGGRCVLGFQSIAQVSTTYGEGEARTIVENCGNTMILRCSASDGGGTARFASTLVGQREVRRVTASRSVRDTELFGSTSRSEHYSIEPAVLASQIEQIPDLCGYLKLAGQPAWLRVRLPAPTLRTASTRDIPAFVPATVVVPSPLPAVPSVAPAAAKRTRKARVSSTDAAAATAAAPKPRNRTRRVARSEAGASRVPAARSLDDSRGLET